MQVIPPALERLIVDLNKLPGIGRKTATRLALFILRRPATEARNLAGDLATLHEAIHLCRQCFCVDPAIIICRQEKAYIVFFCLIRRLCQFLCRRLCGLLLLVSMDIAIGQEGIYLDQIGCVTVGIVLVGIVAFELTQLRAGICQSIIICIAVLPI